MITLYQEKTDWEIETADLSFLFPPMPDTDIKIPPAFSIVVDSHTACLSWQGVKATKPTGNFFLCSEVVNVTEDSAGNY